MRIIHDSGVGHWALLQSHTCEECSTVFQAETFDDFRKAHASMSYVWIMCPRCLREQKMWKNPNTPAVFTTTATDV